MYMQPRSQFGTTQKPGWLKTLMCYAVQDRSSEEAAQNADDARRTLDQVGSCCQFHPYRFYQFGPHNSVVRLISFVPIAYSPASRTRPVGRGVCGGVQCEMLRFACRV